MKSKSALIIFAREPKIGKVKTRLCKDLPSPLVTRLYKAFVKDVLNVALDTQCDERFVYYAGNGASIPFLRKTAKQFQLKRQIGKDLGRRMHAAFIQCQKKHFNKIVIIGTDCLTVTAKNIKRAFKELDSYDCVLGPTKDGGYYLIALRLPVYGLFQGVKWSTSSVLKQTLQKAKKLNKRVFLLNQHEDIDTISDLKKLSRQVKIRNIAVHTQKIIKNMTITA